MSTEWGPQKEYACNLVPSASAGTMRLLLPLMLALVDALRTAPMDAHEAAKSEYSTLPVDKAAFVAAGTDFVPVIGDGLHAVNLTNRTRTPLRRRMLALLNAQWRGGSTLAEQLIFSTTIAPPFLLDEPAKAMWFDENNHKVSTVNFDALRCDFSKFNHTLLLSWQHWRGEFTRQRKLLNYKTFADMRRRCFSAGNGGHLRAVKTIRMTGDLSDIVRSCQRERADGNYSCVLIQLVRHPLSTLKSEQHSSKLPQARGVKNPTIIAPGGNAAWIDSRKGNMSSFCAPLLKDVLLAQGLARRRKRLERKGAAFDHLPNVIVLKYDDLLRRPLEVVKEVHPMLQARAGSRPIAPSRLCHLDCHRLRHREYHRLPCGLPSIFAPAVHRHVDRSVISGIECHVLSPSTAIAGVYKPAQADRLRQGAPRPQLHGCHPRHARRCARRRDGQRTRQQDRRAQATQASQDGVRHRAPAPCMRPAPADGRVARVRRASAPASPALHVLRAVA